MVSPNPQLLYKREQQDKNPDTNQLYKWCPSRHLIETNNHSMCFTVSYSLFKNM